MSNYDLQRCIEKHKANTSHAREVVFRILLDAEGCLNVSEILTAASEIYPKKISLNTVYRHLNLFIECGLAIAIQDDRKKAYYSIRNEKNKVFSICPKCGLIQRINDRDSVKLSLFNNEYIDAEYITVHKKCKKCL